MKEYGVYCLTEDIHNLFINPQFQMPINWPERPFAAEGTIPAGPPITPSTFGFSPWIIDNVK